MAVESQMAAVIMEGQSLVDAVLKFNIPVDDSVILNNVSSLENLIKSGHKDWLVASAMCLTTDPLMMEAFVAKLNDLIHISEPPHFSNREHHDYEAADFVGVAGRTEVLLSFFTSYIKCYLDIDRAQFLRDVIKCIGVGSLLFLVVSNMESKMWTSVHCNQLAVNLSDHLKVIYQCKSYEDLLLATSYHGHSEPSACNIKQTLFSLILNTLQPCLNRTNWKENPIHVDAFLTCLAYVKHPYLSDYLDRVLPTSLLLVDDYMPCYKISGLHALQHIVDNVTSTELKWQGRNDVIYDAVKHAISTNEIPVINASYLCMLTILNKVETLGKAGSYVMKPGRYDEVLCMILSNAEIENNLALMRIYTQYLPPLIDKMGVAVARHSNRLLGLIESYLMISDGDEEIARINTLIILKSFIIQAWPRVASHKDRILKMLLKLVYDLSCEHGTVPCNVGVKDSLLSHVETCLVLLSKCCDANEVQVCLEHVHSTVFKQLSSREFIDKVLVLMS